jgi:hypothetical protein
MLMGFHGCSWVFMDFNGCSSVFMCLMVERLVLIRQSSKKLSTYWGKAATIMNGDRMGVKG